MCRVPATGSLPVLRVACSLAPWPAARMLPSFSFFVDDVDQSGLLLSLAAGAFAIVSYASPFPILGAVAGVQALITRIRFPGCSGGPAIHARPR